MDPNKRRELRLARRERRAAAAPADHPANPPAAAPATGPLLTAGGLPPPALTAPAAAVASRRSAAISTDATRLAEKVRRRQQERGRSTQVLSAREATIQSRYAPNAVELLANDADLSPSPSGVTQARSCTAAELQTHIADFAKDELLAALITEKHSNFLKLDQELSEDHKLATQRLHTSVFGHANNFLLLFRDVDRASGLVEALKASVQGTKAAISAISKFTYANVGNMYKDRPSDAADGGGVKAGSGAASGTSVFGGVAGNSMFSRPRPSLVSRRQGRDKVSGSEAHGVMMKGRSLVDTSLGNAGGPDCVGFELRPDKTNATARARSKAVRMSREAMTAASATTRSLNVMSVLQWKTMIRGDGRRTASHAAPEPTRGTVAAGRPGAIDADSTSSEVVLFAHIITDEVNQLLSERRTLDAAALLRSLSDEAVARGCMPLLLELEAAVVHAVLRGLSNVPVTPMYAESVHLPLIQLLLHFGRWRNGTTAYLMLQSSWLQGELRAIQARANPRYASLTTVDFLVTAIRCIIDRQHTLWLDLAEAHSVLALKRPGRGSAAAAAASPTKHPLPLTPTVAAGSSGPPTTIPPNTAALLWVRDNVAHFASEVLSTQVLSYGTGTDGGDPVRVRRAIATVMENIRALRGLSQEGFGDVDTLTLRALTPSLVVLQTEYTQQTEARLENAGRAMVEHLITSTLPIGGGVGNDNAKPLPPYRPSANEDVARRSNVRCQELLKSLKSLPRGSHMWLVQLLLCPAAASMFDRPAMAPTTGAGTSVVGAGGSATNRTGGGNASTTSARAALLPPEQYCFLRFANGCSTVHDILIQSLLRFTAATIGTTWGGGGTGCKVSAASPSSSGAADVSGYFLLSNAVFTESFDVALYNMCIAGLTTALRGRQAIINYLNSAGFRQQFGAAASAKPPHPAPALLLSRPGCSPGWVFDGMSGLLADVVSTGVWVSYFSVGGAAAHIMGDSTRSFWSRHLESLRRSLPSVVQGWLCATLALGHDVQHAASLLKGRAPTTTARSSPEPPEPAAESAPGPVESKTLRRHKSFPRLMRSTSLLTPGTVQGRVSPAAGNSRGAPGLARQKTLPRLGRQASVRVLGSAPMDPTASNTGRNAGLAAPGDPMLEDDEEDFSPIAEGGRVTVPVQWTDRSGAGHTTPREKQPSTVLSPLMEAFVTEAGVAEDTLLPLLMGFLDTKYVTPATYRVPAVLDHLGIAVAPSSGTPTPWQSSPPPVVWGVRAAIRSYPDFPIGIGFDRGDQFFLLHWCVQITLQLLTHFQERLLVPSYVANGQGGASAGELLVAGCASPREDSPLGALCSGGGNYVAAVAQLQFLVVRLLRDVLCRPATWSAMYGCKSQAEWRSDENVLRQQCFFFAAFLRFWGPLFCGGMQVPVQNAKLGTGAKGTTEATTAAATPTKPLTTISSGNSVDRVPALAIVEWLSAGNILQPAADVIAAVTDSGAAHTTTAMPLPASRGATLLDAFFMGWSGGAINGKSAAPTSHNAKAAANAAGWKSQQPTAATSSVTVVNVHGLYGSCYLPDTLLRVVQQFFESQLADTRAVTVLTSEVMRLHVDRALLAVNLYDFVGTTLAGGSSEEDDESSTTTDRCTSPQGRGPLTLANLRDLLVIYVRPLL